MAGQKIYMHLHGKMDARHFAENENVQLLGRGMSFVYGPDHQRIKQVAPSATTIYLNPDNTGGLFYEKDIKADGTVEHKHYITAGGSVICLLYTSPSPRDLSTSRMPSSA